MPSPIPADLALEHRPFTDEHLDEVIDISGPQPEFEEEQLEHTAPELAAVLRWTVENEEDAEWAMRMVAAYELEMTAHSDQHREWKARIDRNLADVLKKPAGRAAFFRWHLERYALRVRALDDRRATVALPSGKVGTRRAQEPKVEIANEEELLAWLAENLDGEEYGKCVRETSNVLIMELRKLVEIREVQPEPEHDHSTDDECTCELPPIEHVAFIPAIGADIPGLVVTLPRTTATVTPKLQ